MGSAESRLEPLNTSDTPQYLKYLNIDPRSPADGRTPITFTSPAAKDPRSPTFQLTRTPLFEIPEPFDFDKFAGMEPISPEVAKFDNRGYENTPSRLPSVSSLKEASHVDGNVCSAGKDNKKEAKVRRKSTSSLNTKKDNSKAVRRKSLIKKNTPKSKDGEKSTKSAKVVSRRRKSLSVLNENRRLTSKKLEFNENYMSPANRSPLATRNFVRLNESPNIMEAKNRFEKLSISSRPRDQDLYSENSSEKENLIPFRHLTYV